MAVDGRAGVTVRAHVELGVQREMHARTHLPRQCISVPCSPSLGRSAAGVCMASLNSISTALRRCPITQLPHQITVTRHQHTPSQFRIPHEVFPYIIFVCCKLHDCHVNIGAKGRNVRWPRIPHFIYFMINSYSKYDKSYKCYTVATIQYSYNFIFRQ